MNRAPSCRPKSTLTAPTPVDVGVWTAPAIELAQLIADGHRNDEIAARTTHPGPVPVDTARSRIRKLIAQFGVRSRAGVAVAGVAAGVVRVPVLNTTGLTARNRQVVDGVSRGLTNTEIGAELWIGISTVKEHVKVALSVTGCRNRTELAARWAAFLASRTAGGAR